MSTSRSLNNKIFFEKKSATGEYPKEWMNSAYGGNLTHHQDSSQLQNQSYSKRNINSTVNNSFNYNNYDNNAANYGRENFHNNQAYSNNAYSLKGLNNTYILNNMRNDNKIKRGQKPIMNGRSMPYKNMNKQNSRALKQTKNPPNNAKNFTNKNIKFTIVHDESEIDNDKKHSNDDICNKYFSEPVDLNYYKDSDGKIKPVINLVSKKTQQSIKKVYKLSVPINYKDTTYSGVSSLIETEYRPLYSKDQSFKFYNKDSVLLFKTLDAIVEKIKASNRKETKENDANTTLEKIKLNKSSRVLKSINERSFINNTGLKLTSNNDSFELSFDGKALDRSDILRMVDSFSVAFSDDDGDNDDYNEQAESTFDEEFGSKENKYLRTLTNKILPAEITGGGF
ncbi:hypothetical protein TPHA_0I00340 [Tetrapisispora phaffii CBS 4417]|uniref:Uncharacterized protein n=1 Tax=Tetrapisispora phaffii (strain ATCC 24235 / CBS 4417 / NBRC 1672 / NRRL Y-8282 / UCD 70-5) TaxID=1071381 RepID=G8BXB3_TETPH|nr:hypothetical protein TPHA_0I00340 [Tetrapisispora phaffii CBS 4417]CCE64541.1 hypothetical protein TPHA_0I00340 [Tetrapisispora phaffii CBS 4417]